MPSQTGGTTTPSGATETPAVLLVVFNRPATTRQVMEAIRQARPRRLYVAGDGARASRPAEAGLVEATRAVATEVDWPCEVRTRFSEGNQGCKVGVRSAIDWFLGEEEEGIVLEDDVVPRQTFFRYCAELLARYRHDSRVGMIGGSNLRVEAKECRESYYFSRLYHVWGWATWRRAWAQYDREMSLWPEFRARALLGGLGFDAGARRRLSEAFDAVAAGRVDTWDHQWLFTGLAQNAVSIVPRHNLVSNIGYGGDATHTRNPEAKLAALPTQEATFPLVHSEVLCPDAAADRATLRSERSSFPRRVAGLALRTLRGSR